MERYFDTSEGCNAVDVLIRIGRENFKACVKKVCRLAIDLVLALISKLTSGSMFIALYSRICFG